MDYVSGWYVRSNLLIWFRNVMNESNFRPFHLNQPFLIVVTQSTQNLIQTLHDIFCIIMSLGLLDVNVLIEDVFSKRWSLQLYRPCTTNCHSFTVYEIAILSEDNYTQPLNVSFNELFPWKPFKFPDCPPFVAAFAEEPFVLVQKPTNGSNNRSFHGIDIIIVNQISKTMNLTPKYMQPPDKRRRGTIYTNGTASGALGMVRILKIFWT